MLSVKVRPGVSFFQVINESGTADFQFASCASAQEDFCFLEVNYVSL